MQLLVLSIVCISSVYTIYSTNKAIYNNSVSAIVIITWLPSYLFTRRMTILSGTRTAALGHLHICVLHIISILRVE